MKIAKILSSFPKTRPPISDKLRNIYADHYKKNRNGGSFGSFLAQKLESWMHKKVSEATPLKKLQAFNTLEIGAGTLNQLPYEVNNESYDCIEPMNFLYKDSSRLSCVRNIYHSISEIDPKIKYDRIISIAVLEHLDNLPQILEESIKHMVDGSIFACGIPSEGGFLWGVAWRLSTGLEFRIRTGLSYSELMRHEHLNTSLEIESLLMYYFRDVKIKRLGLGRHFSLYSYIECKNPKVI